MSSRSESGSGQLITARRRAVEEKLISALQRYGSFADCKWELDPPPGCPTDSANCEIWQRIVVLVRRRPDEGLALSNARASAKACEDRVRELTLTFKDWLVGPKCLEVRGPTDKVITAREIQAEVPARREAHKISVRLR